MKLPQLTLRDLFWLVALVAMGLGWWMSHGGGSGFRKWLSPPDSRRTDVYYVEDLVQVNAGIVDFDSLMNDIMANVDPGTWEPVGGKGSVVAFPTNLSLVVTHDEESQKKIRAYLKAKRANAASPQPMPTNPFEPPKEAP
jgi:hypothetical protein